MYERANFFLGFHTPNTVDYTKKYFVGENKERESEPKPAVTNLEDTPLYKELRQYRYDTSKAEGIKAYYIYNNAQMEELILAMPRPLGEIKKISGFGEVKCQKYGNAILEMIKKHC